MANKNPWESLRADGARIRRQMNQRQLIKAARREDTRQFLDLCDDLASTLLMACRNNPEPKAPETYAYHIPPPPPSWEPEQDFPSAVGEKVIEYLSIVEIARGIRFAAEETRRANLEPTISSQGELTIQQRHDGLVVGFERLPNQ